MCHAKEAYGTVEHLLSLVATLFNVTLQSTGIQRFQQLETTQKFRRDGHDGAPIVEFAAILCVQHGQFLLG